MQVRDTVLLDPSATSGAAATLVTSYFGAVDNITMGTSSRRRWSAAAMASSNRDDPDFYPVSCRAPLRFAFVPLDVACSWACGA